MDQAAGDVVQDVVEGRRAQRDGSGTGAWFTQVLWGVARPQRGRVRDVCQLGCALAHLERRDGVRAQGQMWSVLLETADRDQDDIRAGQEPLQIRGRKVEEVVLQRRRRLRVRNERAPW